MSEILTGEEARAGAKAPETEFYLATVTTWSTSGVQIQLDGADAPMTKRYKMLRVSRELPVGARVIVMKQSGTYIVLGEVNSPKGYYSPADLAASASLADVIGKVNTILAALRSEGVIWNPS